MKKILHIAFLLTILGLSVASCSQEQAVGPVVGPGVPVTISLNTRAPGDTRPGNEADRKVTSLRVLIYDQRGVLKWNFSPLDVDALEDGTDNATQLNELEITTGTYDFVFIANEGELEDELGDLAVGSTMMSLQALTFSAAAFDEAKNIPMVSHYPSVQVALNNTLNTGHVTYTDPFDATHTVTTNPQFDVLLERAGIRLTLEITLTQSQYDTWNKEILIDSIPAAASLLPGRDNASPWAPDRTYESALSAAWVNEPGKITGPVAGKYTVTYDRLILPEVLFKPVDTRAKSLVLQMTVNNKPKSGKISLAPDNADGWGYTLPRNTWLHMSAEIDQSDLLFTDIRVVDWGGRTTYPIGDRGLVLPRTGIPAPPGVLGINAVTGELTLRGSVHYEGTLAATKSANETLEFGPISADTVYVAYFKWGSLIGLNGGAAGDTFNRDDIGWAPQEYDDDDLSTLFDFISVQPTPAAKWEQIPYASEWPESATPAAAIGDPCAFADDGIFADWKTPPRVDNLWHKMSSTNFSSMTAVDGINGRWGQTKAADYSMFLPLAGARDANGLYGNLSVGTYWSNTPSGANGYVLNFTSGTLSAAAESPANHAFAVRCVKPWGTIGPHIIPVGAGARTINPYEVTYTGYAENWQVENITYNGTATGWLTTVERNGTSSSLKIVILANSAYTERTAVITLKDALTGVEGTVTVNQAGKEAGGFSVGSVYFPQQGGPASPVYGPYNVFCDPGITWVAVVNSSAFTMNPSSGSGTTNNIQFSALTVNNSSGQRQVRCYINFYKDGVIIHTVQFTMIQYR